MGEDSLREFERSKVVKVSEGHSILSEDYCSPGPRGSQHTLRELKGVKVESSQETLSDDSRSQRIRRSQHTLRGLEWSRCQGVTAHHERTTTVQLSEGHSTHSEPLHRSRSS